MEERIVEYKKGEILFREGEPSKEMFIVQTGIVKIYKDIDGHRIPLAVVPAGHFIGELAFFDGKPRSATAEAATDLKAIRIDPAKLEKEVKRMPSWLLVLINSLADRIREADELIKRNKVVDLKIKQAFDQLN